MNRTNKLRNVLDQHMTEQQLQDRIVDEARHRGWRAAHFRPARTTKGWRTPGEYDTNGFPDLVLARAGRVLFLEVKTQRGRVTADQRAWLARLGDLAHLIRPADLPDLLELLT